MLLAQRVAVFIDYQNVYKRARAAFFGEGQTHVWHVHGQVRPVAVGLQLRGDGDRELVAVHVYRGLPSSKHDPKGYSAAQRQIAAWTDTGGGVVIPHHRPLNYREPHRPREKGIDVQLAVDFVLLAQKNEYDVGIIFSDDTDLNPALEAVGELRGPGRAELAAWYDPIRSGPRMVESGGSRVFTHILDRTAYGRLHDTQDYNHPSARKPRPRRRH